MQQHPNGCYAKIYDTDANGHPLNLMYAYINSSLIYNYLNLRFALFSRIIRGSPCLQTFRSEMLVSVDRLHL